MGLFSRWCLPLLFAAVFLMAGCVDLGGERPGRNFYLLNASRGEDTAPGAAVVREPLLVRPFRVSARFDDDRLIYRMGKNRFAADYYHRFLAPPAVMLTEEVSRWLESAGLFGRVLEVPSRIQAGYFLEGDVSALYGDFSVSPPLAVMAMEFSLFRDLPAAPELIFHKGYRKQIPLGEQSPEAVVAALEAAAGEILVQFEQDLREADLPAAP